MKGNILSALLATAFLGLSGMALAADDNYSDALPPEVAPQFAFDETMLEVPPCNDLDCAYLYKCVSEAPTLIVSVADCCIAGDVWRANILNLGHIESTSNQDETGAALPPNVYSDEVGVYGRTAFITVNAANAIPGGLPAGLYVKVRSLGATPVCTLLAAEPDGPVVQ
jgi:hypothetical protein